MKKVGFLAFFMGVGLTNEDIFPIYCWEYERGDYGEVEKS